MLAALHDGPRTERHHARSVFTSETEVPLYKGPGLRGVTALDAEAPHKTRGGRIWQRTGDCRGLNVLSLGHLCVAGAVAQFQEGGAGTQPSIRQTASTKGVHRRLIASIFGIMLAILLWGLSLKGR